MTLAAGPENGLLRAYLVGARARKNWSNVCSAQT